jgi:biotin carboxyl carrier protein
VRLLDINHIKSLNDVMAQSGLAEMEVGEDGWTLRLVRRREGPELPPVSAPKRSAAARPPVERALQNPMNNPDRSTISAPLAGTVYTHSLRIL